MCAWGLPQGTCLGRTFSNSTVNINADCAMAEHFPIPENLQYGVIDGTFCLLTVAATNRTPF